MRKSYYKNLIILSLISGQLILSLIIGRIYILNKTWLNTALLLVVTLSICLFLFTSQVRPSFREGITDFLFTGKSQGLDSSNNKKDSGIYQFEYALDGGQTIYLKRVSEGNSSSGSNFIIDSNTQIVDEKDRNLDNRNYLKLQPTLKNPIFIEVVDIQYQSGQQPILTYLKVRI